MSADLVYLLAMVPGVLLVAFAFRAMVRATGGWAEFGAGVIAMSLLLMSVVAGIALVVLAAWGLQGLVA